MLSHEFSGGIATASNLNLDFARSIGADEVIDYKTTRLERQARDIDVVFDTVGGETLACSWNVLRPGGRVAAIATQSEAVSDQHVSGEFFIVEPNRMQLVEIARLLDAGSIRPFVEAVYPLVEVRDAYACAKRGGMRGKIILQVKVRETI